MNLYKHIRTKWLFLFFGIIFLFSFIGFIFSENIAFVATSANNSVFEKILQEEN